MGRPTDSEMLDLILTVLARLVYMNYNPGFRDEEPFGAGKELRESIYEVLKARGYYDGET